MRTTTLLPRLDFRADGEVQLDKLPRAELNVENAIDLVRPICQAVKDEGAAGIRRVTAEIDGVDVPRTRVAAADLQAALAGLDPSVRQALEESIRRARIVHRAQHRTTESVQVSDGATVSEKWVPVGRVGLYVPGGLTAYPSSVVMNVVPAQEAGVGSLAVASPPQKGTGLPHPAILAACALLGIEEVHAVGGAQAVAMFAYGTEDCARADLVTGPGNVYVAAAKRLLKGVIGIDSEAGPTEIAVLADKTANPRYVAADLISQAEHDPRASAVLVTDDETLAEAVSREVAAQTAATPNRERVETALSSQSAIILVRDLQQGLDVVNEFAAEHLEILTDDAENVAARVTNAGAIFVGAYSPVSLGDYLAGSNHVLPTGGTARHSSGLSVQSFLKGIHIVNYTKEALQEVAPHVQALGSAENLHAHVNAVAVRVSA